MLFQSALVATISVNIMWANNIWCYSMLCYLFMRILLVLCMALTSDLSHLIHTSCWKSTWRVLQSLLLKLDSFEVSVTVVFLKMTRSLSSNCPFSFSRHDFASVICCFFSVWSKISQLTHECALTRSVCLFLSGFLSLFADFLHLSAFLPVFFPSSSPTSHEMVGSLDLAVSVELVEVVPRVPGETLILAWHWGFRMPHTARVSRWKAWRYASSSLFRTLEVQTCKPYSFVTSCLTTAPLLACGRHSAGANERCMWLSLSSLFPVRWQSVPCLLAPHCILVSQVSIS